MHKIVAICYLLLWLSPLAAQEFKYLKLSPLLKERAKLLASPTHKRNLKSNQLQLSDQKLHQLIESKNVADLNRNKDNTPLEEEESSLFQTIINYLTPSYQTIGNQQVSSILHHSTNFDLGVQNFSGLTWQKPMGNFTIGVDRQLAPDLFDDQRWIVSDKFIIVIDATTFLHNLKDLGLIDITQTQLAAFVGISFKREYTYTHFAASYMEGLTSHFDKLFLSFMHFRGNDFLTMEEYEYLSKSDSFSIQAGAGASIPIYPGIGISAAVLATHAQMSHLNIQAIGPADAARANEKFRISFEKEQSTGVSVNAALTAEFYGIIKLTLLSYELEYAYSDAEKMYLSFYQNDLPLLDSNTELAANVHKLLNLRRPDTNVLNPYIVSRERRTQEDLNSHYHILIAGGVKKYHTEQIKIHKDGVLTTFFKNRSESFKYMQNVFLTFLNGITQALFKVDLFQAYHATRTKYLEIEYQGEQNMAGNQNVSVDSEQYLSLLLQHKYTAQKTTGWFNNKYRDYATHFTTNFTSLSSQIAKNIDKKKLVGPLSIQTTARINYQGLTYFNHLSTTQLNDALYKTCSYNPKKKKHQQRKAYNCLTDLTKKYQRYVSEVKAKGDMYLWRLRDFLQQFNKYTDDRNDLKYLFGTGNVFYNGSIQAQTKDGQLFTNYFHDGTFNGLGVVDDFQRGSYLVAIPIE